MQKLPQADLWLIVFASTIAILLVWVAQMPSSLGLDELGTNWVIEGDLAQTASRAWRFHGQTPLFYAFLWGVTQLLGTSEVVLRLPSLLSMLAAAFLLYRFSRRLFGHRTAVVSLAVFLVFPTVGFYASDARPYALAILVTLVATMLLDSWLRTFEPKRSAWYGLAAAALVYVHYVFATILVAHALFFAWVIYRSEADQRRRLWSGGMFAAAVFLVSIAPTFSQMADLLGRTDELVVSGVPPLPAMLAIWAPPVAALVLVGAVALVVGRGERLPKVPANPLILLGLGFVTPPVVLFLLANTTEIVLWSSRYWFAAVPFGAILFGVLISSCLRNAKSVKIATLAVLLTGILAGTAFEHSQDDWRSAISAANSVTDSDTTLLVFSGLVELTNPEYLVDPEKRSYVTSPLAYYPVHGNAKPLPWASLENRAEQFAPYLAELPSGRPVVVIVNQMSGSLISFVMGWFTANGYELVEYRGFGLVRVAAFAPP